MAKLCAVCGSLCAYFLIFYTIGVESSLSDYYFYGIDSRNDGTLLVEEHTIHRRGVENNQSYLKSEANVTTSQNSSASVPSSRDNIVPPLMNRSQTDDKLSTTKPLQKPTKTTKPTAVPTPLEGLQKNLGVNGTGQRQLTTIRLSKDTTISSLDDDIGAKNDTEDYEFPAEDDDVGFNKTLTKHNITVLKTDTHIYYNSSLRVDQEAGQYFWVDLANRSDTKINDLLSRSHRRAATVQLSFEFPFYGHLIKNVTIATGGFLYTGDYVHSWLAATQYIAPLMANFDTSISNDSFIRYSDNGTAFTVEWARVSLQDKPNEGEFTFQTTLHKNGDIVFVYQNVPLFIMDIKDDHHPVKVGLSDAYIIDRTIFLVRRKTIYEYHRINFFKEDIKNWTVIYLTALPTCLQSRDCASCVTGTEDTLKCSWCPGANRCSNGFDRHRQEWLTRECQRKQVKEESMCSRHITGADIFDETNITYTHDVSEFQHQLEGYAKPSGSLYSNGNVVGPREPVRMGVSSIVAILFLIAMVSGLAVWVMYAYRNPHTTSGQILIRYRPSQWRWRRGEARYTAATIHM